MYTTYRVQPGDTLTNIANLYDLSLEGMLAINQQIENPDFIEIGQPLNVPVEVQNSADDLASSPKWYAAARKELEAGVEEDFGKEHNPRIIEYHQTTSLKATDDETSWCSSFVNWCVEVSGFQGTKSAAARSWLNWGQPLNEPRDGCIVVFKRGNKPWQGHVGFYAGTQGNHILVLGGNQGNEVNISSYHKNRLLGYRWLSIA